MDGREERDAARTEWVALVQNLRSPDAERARARALLHDDLVTLIQNACSLCNYHPCTSFGSPIGEKMDALAGDMLSDLLAVLEHLEELTGRGEPRVHVNRSAIGGETPPQPTASPWRPSAPPSP